MKLLLVTLWFIEALNGYDCIKPPIEFRLFYAAGYFHIVDEGKPWMGDNGEDQGTVIKRLMRAMADYSDYLAERGERCGVKRK